MPVEFDYELQCWIVDEIVRRCNHPDRMRRHFYSGESKTCCRAWELQGLTREEAKERVKTHAG